MCSFIWRKVFSKLSFLIKDYQSQTFVESTRNKVVKKETIVLFHAGNSVVVHDQQHDVNRSGQIHKISLCVTWFEKILTTTSC